MKNVLAEILIVFFACSIAYLLASFGSSFITITNQFNFFEWQEFTRAFYIVASFIIYIAIRFS